MKPAWQTWIVAVLGLGSFVVGSIAANTDQLGVTNPWLTSVLIPSLLTAFTLAANQLKAVGSDSPPAYPEPPKPPQ